MLRFIFKMIIVPHPKIVVPPSHPDPLFRFPARENPQWTSPAASLLTPYSRQTTPRRPPSTSPSTDSVSPRRGQIQQPDILCARVTGHNLTQVASKTEGGRSLRRIKGTVTRIVHNQDGDYTSNLAAVPFISIHNVRCAESAGSLSSTPAIEPYVATSNATIISPLQTFSAHLDVPSLVLTMPTPEISSQPSFHSDGYLDSHSGCQVAAEPFHRAFLAGPDADFSRTPSDSLADRLLDNASSRSYDSASLCPELAPSGSHPKLTSAELTFVHQHSWTRRQLYRLTSSWRKLTSLLHLAEP
ncbi:hypothetical protein AB1N83_002516 [Pleurotus pulmonarius]